MTRHRRTNAEIEAFDEAIREIARRVQPATLRQIYYRAVVAELVEKDDRGYRFIQGSVSRQRWSGELPWGWIVDETRSYRQPLMWEDANDGLANFAASYRRDVWRSQPVAVEVWVESDSLAGTLVEITWRLGIPLFSGRGFSSLSSTRTAAEQILDRYQHREQETVVVYVGDLDPAGISAPNTTRDTIRRHLGDLGADDVQFHWHRLAVNPEDVDLYDLPTGRPAKTIGPGSSAWKEWPNLPYTVEAEAFEPADLRSLVEDAVLAYADVPALERAQRAEKLELETLEAVAQSAFTDLGRYREGAS